MRLVSPLLRKPRLTHAPGAGFAEYESTSPVPGLVARARGVVLDLGPGIGNQLSRLDAAAVRHVYGLEPNAAGFAAPLAARLQADAPALEGRYELVPGAAGSGGAAALAARGVRPGDVDCTLCQTAFRGRCLRRCRSGAVHAGAVLGVQAARGGARDVRDAPARR